MKTHTRYLKSVSLLSLGLLGLLLCSCFIDNEKTMRRKLSIICQSDLTTTIGQLKSGASADSVYFHIVSFKTFAKGEFSAKAVVDFYLLKNVQVKMVRKYRFNRIFGLWDRYYNEWEFVHDSTKSK